jgi:hypothetical protein
MQVRHWAGLLGLQKAHNELVLQALQFLFFK